MTYLLCPLDLRLLWGDLVSPALPWALELLGLGPWYPGAALRARAPFAWAFSGVLPQSVVHLLLPPWRGVLAYLCSASKCLPVLITHLLRARVCVPTGHGLRVCSPRTLTAGPRIREDRALKHGGGTNPPPGARGQWLRRPPASTRMCARVPVCVPQATVGLLLVPLQGRGSQPPHPRPRTASVHIPDVSVRLPVQAGRGTAVPFEAAAWVLSAHPGVRSCPCLQAAGGLLAHPP